MIAVLITHDKLICIEIVQSEEKNCPSCFQYETQNLCVIEREEKERERDRERDIESEKERDG